MGYKNLFEVVCRTISHGEPFSDVSNRVFRIDTSVFLSLLPFRENDSVSCTDSNVPYLEKLIPGL